MVTSENCDAAAVAAVHYLRLADLDRSMAAMAPDVVYHGRPGRPSTLEEWIERERRFHLAMGDIVTTIDGQVSDGEMVATRWQLEATHRGPFMGHPATGTRIRMKSMCFDRVHDRKVVEHWGVRDLLSVLRQIGAIPTLDESQAR